MVEAPHRIQRKRTKGWRMPANTIYVGRRTKWGNPFNRANTGPIDPVMRFACEVAPYLDLAPLRGKNQACWCGLCDLHKDGRPLGITCSDCEPCHVDVLLELANEED